ncbi:GNAT family N-acetyltransferase [Halorussus lipolyticus]|uniref:GNAT family N-acetyltransferase n=1 Tax=Halorussus lipolyticus TaxID=3034024 RepID=UPI0023E89711|nr:GNAT family N-acetyltransferase [Halorussus sp. DT80]
MARETSAGSATVREADSGDRLGVRRVLDAAMLDVRDDLGERIDAEDVLVADEGESDSILGALVLVPRNRGAHIDAVAVRRARRAQGVGSALVRTAAERRAPLTAEFDPGVRPFYESLGFEIAPVEDDGNRLRGRYDGE